MNQYVNDFNDTVLCYFNDLKKFKPLPRAKERRLLKKCKKGDLKAKNEILEANLRFVFDIARHYTGRGVPISDLISDGNMGMLRAIEKFDMTKNVKFISYAVWWIRQAMLESIKKRKLIDFVELENEDHNVIDFYQTNDDDNEEGESSKLSLNNFADEIEDDRKESNELQLKTISKLTEGLNDKEKGVIELFYGLNGNKEMTLTDIGKKYELTTERVRQIKKNVMKKMRSRIMLCENLEDLHI